MAYWYIITLFKLSFHGEFAEAIKLINWANKTFFREFEAALKDELRMAMSEFARHFAGEAP